MKRLAIIVASLIATPALAALASPYQRAAEFNAVIEAALPVFGVRAIEQVTFLHVDAYEVRSARCSLMVEIVDVERHGPLMAVDEDSPSRRSIWTFIGGLRHEKAPLSRGDVVGE